MSEPAKIKIGRESLLGFGGSILDKGVGFVAFIFFANYFPPDQFGAAYVVIGAATILKTVIDGFSSALQKRISENVNNHGEFASIGAILVLCFVSVLLAVYVLLQGAIRLPYEHLLPAGILFVGGRSLNYMIKRLYSGVGSVGLSRFIDVADGILTALLKFFLVLSMDLGTSGLIYAPAASGFIVAVTFYIVKFGAGISIPRLEYVHSVVEFARWSTINSLLNTVYRDGGIIVLGSFVGNSAASTFKTAERLTVPGSMPAQEIGNSVVVHVSGRRAAEEDVKIDQWLSTTTILSIPLFFGSLVLGDIIMVTIYGQAYAESGYVLAALSLVCVMDTFQQGPISVLSGVNRPDLITRLQFLRGFCFLPVITLFTYWWGLTGLLSGYVLTKPLGTIFVWSAAKERIEGPLVAKGMVISQIASGLVMFVVIAGINQVMMIDSAIRLGGVVGIGAVVYFSVLSTMNHKIRGEITRRGRQLANVVL